MDEQSFGVRLPARVLPAPQSISAEARAALDRLVDADGIPINAKHPLPDPKDRDGWVRIKAAVDAHYAAGIKDLAGSLRASVETVQLGDTVVHVATPDTATIA
ncbi:hypothetical protein [Novosphingobium kaempferiae]|uniref:hypothetical protein n=1 Tax=Novosphingobium kaempferiae TaxID=2896849 RepID=UPI001E422108|nr:hypothetical protein [Novosphingobium kaempferiae]